jgi:branched-subunit amino acid aminotransferase/4-amino-4-deoxychorismate lyase
MCAAKDLGIDTHETRVRRERLARSDEAFLTSSLSGLRPLVRIDGRAVGTGRQGPVTRAISDQVRLRRRHGADGARLSKTT